MSERGCRVYQKMNPDKCENCEQGRAVMARYNKAQEKLAATEKNIAAKKGSNKGSKIRFCRVCGQEKPLDKDHFYRIKNYKSGFDPVCRHCRNASNLQRRKERQAADYKMTIAAPAIQTLFITDPGFLKTLAPFIACKKDEMLLQVVVVKCSFTQTATHNKGGKA